MLHTPMPVRPLSLHRPWHVRLWSEGIAALRGWLRSVAAWHACGRQRRRELEEWRAAVELDERVLRDIGAPSWLQSEAEWARETREFERRLIGIELRRELRHFR